MDGGLLEGSSQRRVYARRLRSFQFLVLQVLTITLAIGPTSELLAGKPDQIRFAAGLIAVAGYWFSWRVARLAIIVQGDELIVRNLFRTYHLERSSIRAIEQPSRRARSLSYTLKAGIRAVRVDDRVLSATAYVVTPVDGGMGLKGFAKQEVAQLNHWLKTGQAVRSPVDRPRIGAIHMADGQTRIVNAGFFVWRAWLILLALLSLLGASVVLSVIMDPLAK